MRNIKYMGCRLQVWVPFLNAVGRE